MNKWETFAAMSPHPFGNSFDKLRACPVLDTGTNGWGRGPPN